MNGGKYLLEILDRAIEADGAVLGNIQLFNPTTGSLQIVAQRGFSRAFLNLFEAVKPDEPSACARAFSRRERVMIPDVQRDRAFLPYRSIASQAGFRAVQSTPVVVRDKPVGVLSTHFSKPHTLTLPAERALDLCAHRVSLVAEGMLALLATATTEFPTLPDWADLPAS